MLGIQLFINHKLSFNRTTFINRLEQYIYLKTRIYCSSFRVRKYVDIKYR